MKNTMNLNNPKEYAEAIRNYSLFFSYAYEEASKRVGAIGEDAVRAFMRQYEERTGYTADYTSTELGIIDVVAAKFLAANTEPKCSVTKWQHDLWSWHRLEEGWVYGPVKDKEKKTNPCLKSFDLLTEEEVSWDKMFEELYDLTIGVNWEHVILTVGGHSPCLGQHTFCRMMAAMNEAEEEAVDSYMRTTCYPLNKDCAATTIYKVLHGPKPANSIYVQAIAKAISDAYDALPNPRALLTAEEEDAVIGYLGWLEGGLPCGNEIVPLVRPDENELLLAGQALEKMFVDWN